MMGPRPLTGIASSQLPNAAVVIPHAIRSDVISFFISERIFWGLLPRRTETIGAIIVYLAIAYPPSFYHAHKPHAKSISFMLYDPTVYK